MKVCGVELKGNDAVICLMSLDQGLYTLLECRAKKLSIADPSDPEQLKKFQFDFQKLMADYQIEQVAIKERLTRGKFAGGAVSFKLEAAIQLIDAINTSLLSSSQIKATVKKNPAANSFKETGLKQFQEQAFLTALSWFDNK